MTARSTRLPAILVCEDGTEICWWPPAAIPVGPIRLSVLTRGGMAIKSFEIDPSVEMLTYRERAVRA